MTMRHGSKGQLEAAITESLTKFERDYLGRGPKEARTYVVGDMVVVRLQGILSPAELQLSEEPGGVALIKRMRSQLVESCQEQLSALVAEEAGCPVRSMHADISAKTGERVFVFVMHDDLDETLGSASTGG